MTRALCALALAITCLEYGGLARGDVQVSYLVDEKALRGAVAGTTLTFSLYADNGCTTAVGGPATVTIEHTLIERLKRLTPKGATKAAATDRLTAVLTGVSAPSTTFLAVGGTGISPVGGQCRLPPMRVGGRQ